MKWHLILVLLVALVLQRSASGQDAPWTSLSVDSPTGELTDSSAFLPKLMNSGLTVHYDTTYVFQNVAAGGFQSTPTFSSFSDETTNGHTLSGDLRTELNTDKAGWWSGGAFRVRVQNRVGRSIVQRTGSLAAVNNDALFPNVEDKFDAYAFAITECAYEHQLSDTVSIFGGLLNTSQGDENAIAGTALSHAHFMNFALLYSVVEDATTPNTSLGGGVNYTPNESVTGSFSVYGSDETAGENPFRTWQGTTLSTEWTISHAIQSKAGAQTFGFLYGINVTSTDIAADPRLVLISVLFGLPVPQVESNTWAFYYNGHQFIQGNEEQGWGVFARWGISDGNPNPVKMNAALGLGGIGLLQNRPNDSWGAGVFLIDMSNADLLQGLRIRQEVGTELYYNIRLSPRISITPDFQVIDSALPRADTAWVLGLRSNFSF